MKKFVFLSACVCLSTPSMVFADSTSTPTDAMNQHTGTYLELNLGTNLYYGAFISSVDNEIASGTNGFGWSADLGYYFTPTFALEGGFIQSYLNTSDDEGDSAKMTLDVPYAAARFNIPVGNHFSFIAKVGLLAAIDGGTSASFNNHSASESGGDMLVLPFVGVGASYALTSKLDLTLQYQGAVYGVIGAGLLSGGLAYHFS